MKIALAQINPTVGAILDNTQKIIQAIELGRVRGAELIVFPELSVCGYPPEDLLFLSGFVTAIEEALEKIIKIAEGITVILGCVRENRLGGEKMLFNSAAIIQNCRLLGFYDKILLPTYDVFFERRYFEPGGVIPIWEVGDKKIGVTICEDMWQHAKAVEYTSYSRDPIQELVAHKPDLLVNLSASPYYMKRMEARLHVCRTAVATLQCPLAFCNQVGGNDSLIFDGFSLFMDEEGRILKTANGFQEDLLVLDLNARRRVEAMQSDPTKDLFEALVLGIRDYFYKSGFKKACLGLSGGIDSALVAVLAQAALGKENVLALILPSRYSTTESYQDANRLIKNLGIHSEELSIEKPFETFLELLAPYFAEKKTDVTEENLQARIRGNILMAFSNKFGYLVLSTGNKSELAMGFSTLYGDMCGGLGVLSDVTKEQIYVLAHYINREKEVIPSSVICRPPSAELRYNQKDTDTLPDYAIVDRVLEGYVEDYLSPEEIAKRNNLPIELVKTLIEKIHFNEYKRRQAPPGLRVTKKAFSAGRRFPIVQGWI